MEQIKIIVLQCQRADKGYSTPIIKRLEESEIFKPYILQLVSSDFEASYNTMNHAIYAWKPDLILVIGDRIEMTGACACAYHNHITIAQYGAGITNYPISTFDDINRHCISLWSDIQLCDNKRAMLNVERMFSIIGKTPNLFVVGITHMDDIELDTDLVPDYEYDLVLINPTTTMEDDLKDLPNDVKNVIRIGSNADPTIYENKLELHSRMFYKNLPRFQFLGLLKHCNRFITNSSSAYYEAPYLINKEKIIIIGERNKNRSSIDCELGGSDKIIEVLTNYYKNFINFTKLL